ncbi:MAG: transcriptional regulator, partial [Microvirga sp.]
DASGTTSHYRYLDTTRDYALRKLSEAGESDRLRRHHAEHMLDLAARAEAEWNTRPAPEWIGDHRRHLDDIRLALSWAFADDHEITIGVALTALAIPLWEHLSLVEECRASVERALAHADGVSMRKPDEMKLRTALGTTLLHTCGPVPQVRLAWTKALHLSERLDDGEYQLRCLWGLCDYHTWIGDHRAAFAIANRIKAVASARDDLLATTNVDRQIGTSLRYLGKLNPARDHLERMITHFVPPPVRAETARFQLDPRLAARGTLANVLWLQGHPEQAARMAEKQLAGARQADHALALCNALVHTACPLALLAGDLPGAERLLAGIEDHVARHAMTVWSAMGRCLRGEWLLESGDMTGLDVLRHALEELSDMGFAMRRPFYLGILAQGLGTHGQLDAAHGTIEQAMTLSQGRGEVWCMPELLRIKGDLLRLSGPSAAASKIEASYKEAVEWARRQGALSWELRSATALAEHRHHSGDGGQAEHVLGSTYARFTEGFGTRDLVRARVLLDELRRAGGEDPVPNVVTLLTSHPSGQPSRRKS